MASRDVFRLLDLPGELREIIYYHSAEDLPAIDTAAIKNHGISKVPLIAQLCRDVREECLAVLYRNRELRFSFHCERNIERGNMWLHAAGHHSEMPCTIVFAGVLKQTSEFFHVTIRCSKDQPQFHVATRPGASKKVCHDPGPQAYASQPLTSLDRIALCPTCGACGKVFGRQSSFPD